MFYLETDYLNKLENVPEKSENLVLQGEEFSEKVSLQNKISS
jgi:hypothetical protein